MNNKMWKTAESGTVEIRWNKIVNMFQLLIGPRKISGDYLVFTLTEDEFADLIKTQRKLLSDFSRKKK